MKVLAIISVCPVPGAIAENDLIVQFYRHLQESHPEVEVKILRPAIYANSIMSRLKASWKSLYEARKVNRFEIQGFEALIVPYFFISQFSPVYHALAKLIYLTNRKRIDAFLRGYEYDVIHAHYIHIDGELARQISLRSGKPYVVSTQREARRFRNQIERKSAKRVVESAAAVTSLSPYAAEKISQISSCVSTVIPYGIDELFFKLSEHRQSSTGRVGRFKLITVCRLLKLKNIDVVLRALKELSRKYEFEFTIIGDGPERSRLETIASAPCLQGRIRFEGYLEREQIREALFEHDLFVMPSSPETYGLVYAEAMACGLPILCAKENGFCGHFPERKAGLSVEAFSVQDTKSALEFFFENPEELKRMSSYTFNFAKKFSKERCCVAYTEIFNDVLNRSGESQDSSIV